MPVEAEPRGAVHCKHCGVPVRPGVHAAYVHVDTGDSECEMREWIESGWSAVEQQDRVRISYPDGSVLIGTIDEPLLRGDGSPSVVWFRSQATGYSVVSIIGTTVEVLRSDSERQLPSASNS